MQYDLVLQPYGTPRPPRGIVALGALGAVKFTYKQLVSYEETPAGGLGTLVASSLASALARQFAAAEPESVDVAVLREELESACVTGYLLGCMEDEMRDSTPGKTTGPTWDLLVRLQRTFASPRQTYALNAAYWLARAEDADHPDVLQDLANSLGVEPIDLDA